MKIKANRRRTRPQVTIVPLIDIMVMVLIFFTITMAPRETRHSVEIILANSGSAEQSRPQGSYTVVSLDPEGNSYVNDQQLSDQAFIQRLQEIRAAQGSTFQLAVRFDQDARHKHMLQVADWIRQSGIELTNTPSEVSPPTSP